MIEKELNIINELINEYKALSNRETVLKDRHQSRYLALKTVYDLVIDAINKDNTLEKCPVCEKYFLGHKSKKFCSTKCRVKNHRLEHEKTS